MSYAGWRLFPVAWSAPEEQRHLICTWARAEVMSVNPVLEVMMMMIIVLEFDRQGTPPLTCLQPPSWEYYHFTNEETEFRLFGQRPSFSQSVCFCLLTLSASVWRKGLIGPTELQIFLKGMWVSECMCSLVISPPPWPAGSAQFWGPKISLSELMAAVV